MSIYLQRQPKIIFINIHTFAEATCFDRRLSSHETDVDCGGEFCTSCNITQACATVEIETFRRATYDTACVCMQGCRTDGDCLGDLICLYSHQLPSGLLYISRTNGMAFTCGKRYLCITHAAWNVCVYAGMLLP